MKIDFFCNIRLVYIFKENKEFRATLQSYLFLYKLYCDIKTKCYSVIKMRKVQPHQACIITSILIDLRMEPNSSYWAWSLTVFWCMQKSFGFLQALIFVYLWAKYLFQATHLQIKLMWHHSLTSLKQSRKGLS